MRKIIRLTESELHNIINNAVMKILQEDGPALGGTSSFSVNSLAGGGLGSSDPTGQGHNHIDANSLSSKPLKQKHNLGKPKTEKANMVDITPALDRTPGFSVGTRVGSKKK